MTEEVKLGSFKSFYTAVTRGTCGNFAKFPLYFQIHSIHHTPHVHAFSSSILRGLVFYGTLSTWRAQQVGCQVQPSGYETLQKHCDSLRANIHWFALTPVMYLTNASTAVRRTRSKASYCRTVSITGLLDKYSCLGINVTWSACIALSLRRTLYLATAFTAPSLKGRGFDSRWCYWNSSLT